MITALLIWWYLSSYESKKNQTIIFIFWGLATVLHAYSLFPIFENNSINLSLYYALLVVAFIISFFLYISSIFGNTQYLGIIILPILSFVFLLEFTNAPVNISLNNFLFTHIILSLISYSILCVSAAQSLILKLQEKKLQKNMPIGFIGALPSLNIMDKLLFKLLALGVIFLSLSLLSGLIFLDDIFAQHLAHKTILSIIAWFIFVYLIFSRYKYGYRGTKAANITLVGFFILFLSYFGTKIVLEMIL